MSEQTQVCAACGAVTHDGRTCRDHFDQMLVWEYTDPRAWSVHHLTVLCYYIQHPHLYSPEGLAYAVQLLEAFVVDGADPAAMRRQDRERLDSSSRTWKFVGEPASHGRAIGWPVTVVDVTAGGLDGYAERVRTWARSVYDALNAS